MEKYKQEDGISPVQPVQLHRSPEGREAQPGSCMFIKNNKAKMFEGFCCLTLYGVMPFSTVVC